MEKEKVYLDTSSYLSILFGEAKSTEIKNFLNGKNLCSSTLLILEAERNLIRSARENIIQSTDYEKCLAKLKEDSESFLLKEFTLNLCLTNKFPPTQTPRSGDLAHLRTALWFQENKGLDFFITLDEAQRRSAVDFGLPVKSF